MAKTKIPFEEIPIVEVINIQKLILNPLNHRNEVVMFHNKYVNAQIEKPNCAPCVLRAASRIRDVLKENKP